MMRTLFTFALLLTASFGWAQTIGDIAEGWASKPINNVANGRLAIMLERFNQTWPYYPVEEAIEVMKTGESKKVIDKDTERTVINDAKNGYVEVSDAGSDAAYMSACAWRRSNGHQLFAVVVGQPTDPDMEICCLYDYDPQRHVLTPEPQILADFLEEHKGKRLSFALPQKGKELKVTEYASEGGPVLHHFIWDDMKPVYEYPEYLLVVDYRGDKPTILDFVDAFLSDLEEEGSDCDNWESTWGNYRKGKKSENTTFTIDERNGYVRIESRYDDEIVYQEFCFWNCADGRKLIAKNSGGTQGGKEFSTECTGITFYSYAPGSNIMNYLGWGQQSLGIEMDLSSEQFFRLPRSGKNIEWFTNDGKKGVFKWNGNGWSK